MTFQDILNEETSTFKSPIGVAKEAQQALDAKEKYGNKVKGGTRIGWTRANQLAKRKNISFNTIKRMYSFFSRHAGNKEVSKENKGFSWGDAGYTAWKIWGGDSGRRWAEKIVRMNKND